MEKADNIVFNKLTKEYDAFKKDYPTSFNSKNFALEEIKDLKKCQPPLLSKKNERNKAGLYSTY